MWRLLITATNFCLIRRFSNRQNHRADCVILKCHKSPLKYTLSSVFLSFVPFLFLNLFFGNLINFTLRNPLHSQTLILFLSKNLKPSFFIHDTLKLFTLLCKPFPSLFTLFMKLFTLIANTLAHFHSHYSRQSLSHALSLSRKHSVSANPLTAKPNTPSQKTIVAVCSVRHRRRLEGRPPRNDFKSSSSQQLRFRWFLVWFLNWIPNSFIIWLSCTLPPLLKWFVGHLIFSYHSFLCQWWSQ